MSVGGATRMSEVEIDPMESVNPPQRDVVTWAFLSLVAVAGILYVCLGLTPSSYGLLLNKLGAPEAGPMLGRPRPIRSDEWAVFTPLIQAAVRNDFREVNETSLYREDLRSVFPVPLRNWSLLFRPQQWAFFVTGAPTAFSIYFAFLFCASLAGYTLVFRKLGADGPLAAAASLMVFFSGLVQFMGLWMLAGLPWLLLILLTPMAWRRKALLLAWLMPATALALPYPVLLINFALASLVLLLAVRRDWFRSPREIAAVAVGVFVTGSVLYAYFARLIPIMANTAYPGHRISPPGTVLVPVVLSQVFPFLAIDLGNFRNLTGLNVVEIGTVGTFLPLLTLCLMRFRDLWRNRPVRLAMLILLSAAAVMTLWQVAPLPRWIGRIFLWDTADPERLFLATGLLLIFASVLVWVNQLLSLHPVRIAIFLIAGPIGSVILKHRLFSLPFAACQADLAICGFATLGCLMACYFPAAQRASALLMVIAFINLSEFGRFNPLQPADPIFHIPETAVFQRLKQEEAAMPDHVLRNGTFFGATLNGMGFRSVAHVLPAPQLAFFRKYFPTMNEAEFNRIFNRFAHIQLTDDPLPNVPQNDVIHLPRTVFELPRNLRQVSFAPMRTVACAMAPGGAIERVLAEGDHLTIAGWAPWTKETGSQEILVLSARQLHAGPLITLQRPDIGELMRDYSYSKAGFEFSIVAADGRPIRRDEITLIARGTSSGDVRLGQTGCR